MIRFGFLTISRDLPKAVSHRCSNFARRGVAGDDLVIADTRLARFSSYRFAA